MRTLYTLRMEDEDGLPKYVVLESNPCRMDSVNSNYVTEARVMLQHIMDVEALKKSDDRCAFEVTRHLITMKQAFSLLQCGDDKLDIDKVIYIFAKAFAGIVSYLNDTELEIETEKAMNKIKEQIEIGNETF